MENIKIMSAKEARRLTDDSEFLFKSVNKWIKESAGRNSNSIFLDGNCFDKTMFENVLNALKANGYELTLEPEDEGEN